MSTKYILVSICALGRSNFDNSYEIYECKTKKEYQDMVLTDVNKILALHNKKFEAEKVSADTKLKAYLSMLENNFKDEFYVTYTKNEITISYDASETNEYERTIYTWILRRLQR